ncbi:MAG: PH domain-containing protein [Oscillospiraceae bacterium]|nr:PH domain-containing protein [Oscillospiraceae bacterium]
MTLHKPHRGLMTIWRMYLTAAALIPAFLFSLFLPFPGFWWRSAAIIWGAVFLALYAVYIPMRFSAKSFRVENGMVVSCGGVVYRYSHSLPIGRIQYVSLVTGPAERLLGMCTVVIAAPGGKLVLSGLKGAEGLALAQALSGTVK